MPPTDLVRAYFRDSFGEGSRRTLGALTPMARLLDAVMRRTLLPRGIHSHSALASPPPDLSDVVSYLGLTTFRDGGHSYRGIQGPPSATICPLDLLSYTQGLFTYTPSDSI